MDSLALLKISISLLLIILLIFVLALVARRLGLAQSTEQTIPLRIIQRLRLGTRMQVMVIETNDKRLIIGATPHHISLLDKESLINLQPKTIRTNPITSQREVLNKNKAAQTDFSSYLKKAQTSTTPVSKQSKRLKEHLKVNIKQNKGLLKTIAFSLLVLFILILLLMFSEASQAQTLPIPSITSELNEQGQQVWSLSVETLVVLTLLTFIPAALVMMTGFTRIIIVLGLLRNAMGTGAAPPNSILIGIALFLTFFAMAPVFDEIYEKAYQPLTQDEIDLASALQRGAEPLKEFMLHQTRENDLIFYADLAQVGPFEGPEQVPLRILVPAFITSELKTAFQIGFTVFIPFLIIDLVVASVLMSLGMMMVPPVTISLPFKLMLFVLADGWYLLLGSLARSFYV